MISLLPPGPRGHPILGSIQDIQRDNIGTFMTAFRQYGDMVSFRGPLKIDLVVRPDETSPKICEEWKRTGGKVEELR